MEKAKVEWVEYMWNPVTGLFDGEGYCYSRKKLSSFTGDVRMNLFKAKSSQIREVYVLEEQMIAENGQRITFPLGETPTLYRYRMDVPKRWKMTRNILTCGLGDLFNPKMPYEVIEEVIEAARKFPNHHYLFITEFPGRYLELEKQGLLPGDENFWFGALVKKGRCQELGELAMTGRHTYQVCEPLQDRATVEEGVEWLVIGPDPEGRSEAPPYSAVLDLVTQARLRNVPVFMCGGLPLPKGSKPDRQLPAALMEKKPGEIRSKIQMARCPVCGKDEYKGKQVQIHVKTGRSGFGTVWAWLCPECFLRLCEEWGIPEPGLAIFRKGDSNDTEQK